MEKLQMHSRVDIVRYAVKSGRLTEDAPEPPVVPAEPGSRSS
jgi:hypothetical protein